MAPERATRTNEVILESLRPKLEDETVLSPLANVAGYPGAFSGITNIVGTIRLYMHCGDQYLAI